MPSESRLEMIVNYIRRGDSESSIYARVPDRLPRQENDGHKIVNTNEKRRSLVLIPTGSICKSLEVYTRAWVGEQGNLQTGVGQGRANVNVVSLPFSSIARTSAVPSRYAITYAGRLHHDFIRDLYQYECNRLSFILLHRCPRLEA